MKYLKSDARLLLRDYVNIRGFYLSKEVLLVFLGQRVAEVSAIKVGGLKKNSTAQPSVGVSGSNRLC